MKRITVLTLSISILLLGSLSVAPVNSSVMQDPVYDLRTTTSHVGVDQTTGASGSYYPIFVNITSNAATTEIRGRNNTLGEGAIVQVQEKANVTFTYAVALQNSSNFAQSTVDFRLYADLPVVNNTNFNTTDANPQLPATGLSITDKTHFITLIYTGLSETGFMNYTTPDGSTIQNATLYYYQNTVDMNMSVSYVPFYAADLANSSLSETANHGAYNLLTTKEYTTSAPQDELFIQNDKVNITGNLLFDNTADSNNMDLALRYDINNGAQQTQNLTLTYIGNNGTGWLNLTQYKVGTVIHWQTVMYAGNDTLIGEARVIANVDSKTIEIGDGTPHLDIKISPNDDLGYTIGNTTYSSNFSITYTITTSVPKGNITELYLVPTTDSTTKESFNTINGSYSIAPINQTIDYSQFTTSTDGGEFNTTIVTLTNKGIELNQTFTIVIDKTTPTITSLTSTGGASVETKDGRITFNFGYSDTISGVRMAVLNFGDGSSAEVTGMTAITHKYIPVDNQQTFEYTLTVYDHAGHQVSQTGTITVTIPSLTSDSAPYTGVIIFFVVLVALITSFWWGPKVVEFINNRR